MTQTHPQNLSRRWLAVVLWPIRFTWRMLRFPVYAVLGLLFATSIAFGIGYAIYDLGGSTNSYDDMRSRQITHAFVSSILFRSTGPEIGAFQIGAPRNVFEQRSRFTWRPAGGNALAYQEVASAVYQADGSDRVTRVCIMINNLNEAVRGNATNRARAVLGPPDAELGPYLATRLPETLVWVRDDRLLTLEFRNDAPGTDTMILNMIHRDDPRFAIRRETGGLPLTHRQSDKVRKLIRQNKEAQEAIKSMKPARTPLNFNPPGGRPHNDRRGTPARRSLPTGPAQ